MLNYMKKSYKELQSAFQFLKDKNKPNDEEDNYYI